MNGAYQYAWVRHSSIFVVLTKRNYYIQKILVDKLIDLLTSILYGITFIDVPQAHRPVCNNTTKNILN